MQVLLVRKVLSFLYNQNIEIVEDIFKGKVADYMLSHLVEQAKFYAQNHGNERAWLEFILSLDDDNCLIIADHMLLKKQA